MHLFRLAIVSLGFGIAGVYVKDREAVREAGFLQGYSMVVVVVILLQVSGEHMMHPLLSNTPGVFIMCKEFDIDAVEARSCVDIVAYLTTTILTFFSILHIVCCFSLST